MGRRRVLQIPIACISALCAAIIVVVVFSGGSVSVVVVFVVDLSAVADCVVFALVFASMVTVFAFT